MLVCHIMSTGMVIWLPCKIMCPESPTAGSLKHLVFLGKIHRESPQKANYYGDSKLLRRSIFSTAGSFGHLFPQTNLRVVQHRV